MNRYTRLALNIGGMVALFFAGRFIYKKIKEKEILRNFGSLSNIGKATSRTNGWIWFL